MRLVIRWLVIVLMPAWLGAQTVSLDLSPPIQESERTIALIQLLGHSGEEPAALEWTLSTDTAKLVQIEPGEQALAAKKQITCAHSKARMTCLIWGANRNSIHNGIVAKVIVLDSGFHMHLAQISAATADGRSLAIRMTSEAREVIDTKSLRSGFSAILAGIALLAIFAAIYLARRLSASRSISKQVQASGRSGSPQ